MKLFWKIFITVFISFIFTIFLISYSISIKQLSDIEKRVMEEIKIVGSFVSKDIEVGYLKSMWPFETLKKLSESENFLFWWIVKDDDTIFLADNVSFMGTNVYEYFPEFKKITEDEKIILNKKQNYGIFIKTLIMGKEKWSFWLGFSLKNISEMRKNIVHSFIIILFLALLILGITLYFQIMFFIKPIFKMSDILTEVGKGNLNIKIEIESKDEIGQLASHFNQMIQELKTSRTKLEEYSKSLEKQVQERTKELEEKVKELTETKSALLNIAEDLEATNKELLKAQAELKRSYEDLKKLDLEKDRFISIAAHELKTPMTAISGFAQLLKNEAIINDKEKRVKYLKIIEDEIKRLSVLVTDVLDLSRIDLGTMKISIEEANIKEILNEIKESMQELAKQKGLYLEVKVDEKASKIFTDIEKLKRILINLVGNSIKYTEKGGITVEAVKEKEYVRFCVIDTGIGIPKEHFDKIFTRFYQVASPYTRKVGGSGLGLSICKELVELLGGKIWFESEVGKGSKFYFTLPIKYKGGKKQ
ncbi:MAG: ATP-binding protein [Candidatus Aenigmatarchaeota archaeon]